MWTRLLKPGGHVLVIVNNIIIVKTASFRLLITMTLSKKVHLLLSIAGFFAFLLTTDFLNEYDYIIIL